MYVNFFFKHNLVRSYTGALNVWSQDMIHKTKNYGHTFTVYLATEVQHYVCETRMM